MKMINNKIKICYPLLESDFRQALKILHDNIARDSFCGLDYLKSGSEGEVLIAKDGDEIVGVLKQNRPGKIFNELPDEHFDLENTRANKNEIGYISWIAIDQKYQGRGIGKILVDKSLKYQKEWQAKAVVVHCWQGSPGNASQKMFEKVGFKPLKMFKSPWYNHSKETGPENYWCVVCGNPCVCDELEMIKYI